MLQLPHVPVEIWSVPLQIQYGIRHQLARQMMGHFSAPINAMQRGRRFVGVEMQVFGTGTPPEGVTGGMLQEPHCCGAGRILEKALLPKLLIPPSRLKRDERGWLKKKCLCGVFRRATRY
jgi:hypothetical protein